MSGVTLDQAICHNDEIVALLRRAAAVWAQDYYLEIADQIDAPDLVHEALWAAAVDAVKLATREIVLERFELSQLAPNLRQRFIDSFEEIALGSFIERFDEVNSAAVHAGGRA